MLVGFCIYNLNGFVDMESLQWARPSFANVNENMVDFLQYNRDKQLQRFGHPKQARGLKILCDIDRVCDVEDSVYDWNRFKDSSNQPLQMPIVIAANLQEHFEVKEVFFNESDQHYSKKIMRAVKPSCNKVTGSTTNFNLIL